MAEIIGSLSSAAAASDQRVLVDQIIDAVYARSLNADVALVCTIRARVRFRSIAEQAVAGDDTDDGIADEHNDARYDFDARMDDWPDSTFVDEARIATVLERAQREERTVDEWHRAARTNYALDAQRSGGGFALSQLGAQHGVARYGSITAFVQQALELRGEAAAFAQPYAAAAQREIAIASPTLPQLLQYRYQRRDNGLIQMMVGNDEKISLGVADDGCAPPMGMWYGVHSLTSTMPDLATAATADTCTIAGDVLVLATNKERLDAFLATSVNTAEDMRVSNEAITAQLVRDLH